MPTTDPVKIPFVGDDKVSPVVKTATMNIREMGEKISSLGIRMSAAITLPVTLAAKSLVSFGANSSKTLSDLNKNIADANASQDPAKIKAAWQEWNNLSPSIREAGVAYDRLQEALKPVNEEFDKAKATLLSSLVPLMKELAPTLVNVARGIGDVARGFAALPRWQKTAIIGFVGFAAALGPIIAVVGQVVNTFGVIQLLSPGFTAALGGIGKAATGMGAGFTAALGPIVAVGAAILLWKQIFESTAWKQSMAILGGSVAGLFGGQTYGQR